MQQIRYVESDYLKGINNLLEEDWKIISVTTCNKNGAYIVLEKKEDKSEILSEILSEIESEKL